MSSKKIWLITDASSGLGAALAVLKAGHRVIGTARDISKARPSYPQVEELGGTWAQLDVTDVNTPKIVDNLIRQEGGIDVVVNNAGYAILGGIEDMSEEEYHKQIKTNLYGPIRVLKCALPHLRAKQSGVIINFSSIAGPSESLAAELAHFGIRVLVVQPGGFRAGFMSAYIEPKAGMNPAYKDSPLSQTLDRYRSISGLQKGDPVKASIRIIEVVEQQGMGANTGRYLRIILGPDCYGGIEAKLNTLKDNYEAMRDIAQSTDLNE